MYELYVVLAIFVAILVIGYFAIVKPYNEQMVFEEQWNDGICKESGVEWKILEETDTEVVYTDGYKNYITMNKVK